MALPLRLEPQPDDRSEAFERAMHRTLTATEDYTRRIHWWVRLFGVVWLASIALGVVAFLWFVTVAASSMGQ